MKKSRIWLLRTVSASSLCLLLGTSAMAQENLSNGGADSTSQAQGQGDDTGGGAGTSQAVESVVVTGSRVISDIANSPTPLTLVTTAQLQATTPSNIPDALNKLPVFQGSSTPSDNDNASNNNAGNVLDLRNFGAQRTLVLLDGQRVAPSNANGTVDIDTLPQMLMQRVDVVTGGASAVYGSDAVTGVVNFILDKHFDGLKFDVNSGISTYADGASYKAGLAAGTNLLDGRAHFEMSIQHFHQDGVYNDARTQGLQDWLLTGAGSATNPYVSTEYSTRQLFAYGGKITCTGCAANGEQFISNGVIGPFNAGANTGTTNIGSGGDGIATTVGELQGALTTDQSFGRFSYDLNDTTAAYIQATAAQSNDRGTFQNNYIQTGTVPNTFYKTNPFLTPAAQALLTGTTNTFQLAEWITDQGDSGFETNGLNRNLSVTAGVDGTLWKNYAWSIYYTHGENRLKVDDPNNQNNQEMYAAEDAVPTSSGQVACYVSTTAYAGLYPGCVPMDPFGPTALTTDQYKYFLQDTYFIMTNTLDDVGGSVSGDVFDDWAGPVKAALSGEMRWLKYAVASNTSPTEDVDCTGLRLCNSSTPLFQGNVVASLPEVSENVWELAGEMNFPLLKDMPFVQSLDTDIAGRYTDYSTSGAVQTWKIGLDYHVNDDIRFRATNSVDIRAPTLNDLFSPQQVTHESFTDLHTGDTNGTLLLATQGNPNLVPEEARTYTGGVVLTPTWVPNLTVSIDYYNIALKNAISSISASSSAVQNLCDQSGGTSPFCALFIRPLPFSNTTSANFPTEVVNEELNTAVDKLEGLDLEGDYGFDLAELEESLQGTINLRLLATIQPVDNQEQYPGAPLTFTAAPKGHVTGFVGYKIGNWGINLEDRWLSGYNKETEYGEVYAVPRVNSIDYLDANIDFKFVRDDHTLDAYFSIQNIANTQPPVAPFQNTSPGLYFMGNQGDPVGYDVIGRYFTVGLRAEL